MKVEMRSRLYRFFMCILFLSVLLCFLSDNLYSQDKVRVIKEGAVLRLYPDPNSKIIQKLPVGLTITYDNLINGWFKVTLLRESLGYEIIGYVHPSFVEIVRFQTEKKPIKETIINREKLIQTYQQNDFHEWEQKVSQTVSKKNMGVITIVGGICVLIPSIIYTVKCDLPPIIVPLPELES